MAIAYVNGTVDSYGNNSQLTVANTSTVNVTTGNAVIVFVGSWNAADPRTVSQVTDNATTPNTYVKCGSSIVYNSDFIYEVWAAYNVNGKSDLTVTATYSDSANFRILAIAQYSGMATASAYDAESTGNITPSGQTHTTDSLTTSQANEIVIGFYTCYGTAETLSNGTGTIRLNAAGDVAVADRAAATAGSYTVSISSGANTQYLTIAKSFKQAASSSIINKLAGPFGGPFHKLV